MNLKIVYHWQTEFDLDGCTALLCFASSLVASSELAHHHTRTRRFHSAWGQHLILLSLRTRHRGGTVLVQRRRTNTDPCRPDEQLVLAPSHKDLRRDVEALLCRHATATRHVVSIRPATKATCDVGPAHALVTVRERAYRSGWDFRASQL